MRLVKKPLDDPVLTDDQLDALLPEQPLMEPWPEPGDFWAEPDHAW